VYERVIGVDWSGAGLSQRQEIYVAEATAQDPPRVLSAVRAADRAAVEAFLRSEPLKLSKAWSGWKRPEPLAASETVLVGLDFAFGFPRQFSLPGGGTAWSWERLADWCKGFEGKMSWRSHCAQSPRWRSSFAGPGGSGAVMHLRRTEEELVKLGERPASVFNLVGAQQVGAGSIRGIPILARLRGDRAAAVWPFDEAASRPITVVEVFPRLWLTAGLGKQHPSHRIEQLRAWEKAGIRLENETELVAVASADAMDAVAAAIGLATESAISPARDLPADAEREGWIAGVSALRRNGEGEEP
jgi:hypothetical protein